MSAPKTSTEQPYRPSQAQWLCFNPHCPSRSNGFQTERALKAHFAHYPYCADITASTWQAARQAMAQQSQTTTANTAHRNSTYAIRVAGLFPNGDVPAALQNLGTTDQLQGSPSDVLQISCIEQNVLDTDPDIDMDLPSITDNTETDAVAAPIPAVNAPQASTDTMMNTTQSIAAAAAPNVQQQQQSITQGQVPVAAHTTTQAAVVDLLSILNDANVPDYLFESIMKWARKYHDAGFDFCPPQRDRRGNLKWIAQHLECNHGIQPRIATVQLPGAPGITLDCVVYDFVGQLMSLLNDPTLMKWDNLQLNKASPLSMYLPPDSMIADTHTGSVYRDKYRECIGTPHANKLLCPIILYID